MLCGGAGAEQPANDEIRQLCLTVKDGVHAAARNTGFAGDFTKYEPVSYKTQVVAGTNFFIKLAVTEDQFLHARIFKPLPCNGANPEVHSVQINKALADPVEHF
eukprot:EG_transcript_34656